MISLLAQPQNKNDMIAKAKSISHGINAIRYMSGESEHKKHPEKIYHVCNHFLGGDMDTMGIWTMMNFSSMRHPSVKNNVIRLEISPSVEHTADFTIDDWKRLWDEFVAEFDKQKILDARGKLVSDQTNLAGSLATVWLHKESKGGTPHLHAAVCRVDEQGNVNNDHAIHLRAQRAAEIIARRRGWTTACEIRDNNLRKVSYDCLEVLKRMGRWSWQEYSSMLQLKGYDVRLRRDMEGVVRGYVLAKGNAKYKASELGYGRKLTARNIENTWKALHQNNEAVPESVTKAVFTEKMPNADGARFKIECSDTDAAVFKIVDDEPNIAFSDYTERVSGTTRVGVKIDGEVYDRFIPNDIRDYFDAEFDYRSIVNWQELTNLATAYFTMLATPEVSVNGGGSTGNDLKWGRDPHEDEMEWARRCAQAAMRALGKRARYGRRR